MEIPTDASLQLNVHAFGGVEYPAITVIFPPSKLSIAEVASFAPERLQVVDSEQPGHMALVRDQDAVVCMFPLDQDEAEAFCELLSATNAYVLTLITHSMEGEEPALLARVLIYENLRGRIASDTKPLRIPLGSLLEVMAKGPTKMPLKDMLDGELLGNPLDFATLLNSGLGLSSTLPKPDPSDAN